jgi:transposase
MDHLAERSKTMSKRIIGIDLAVTGEHKAVVLDQATNAFVTPVMAFRTDPAEMDRLVARACRDAGDKPVLVAVLEATSTAWVPVSRYLQHKGVVVYRVSGQQVKDMRRVYQRHAKSDSIDVRVLARLPLLHPNRLQPLELPSGDHMALQRACREVDRLRRMSTAIKNRLRSYDHLAWPGASQVLPAGAAATTWWRQHWYHPWRVVAAGEVKLRTAWCDASPDQPADTCWIPQVIEAAQRAIALYQTPQTLGYDELQAQVQRELERLHTLQDAIDDLRRGLIRPLYRQIYPQRHLETLKGVGEDSAAVYIAFIGTIHRFPHQSAFRAWSGMIPASSQSALAQAQGLTITHAGPDLVKSTAYLNAGVARLFDPHIAAIYYTQIMERGKHHHQAICACATHLLDRIFVVLKENRPYQLRNLDGQPITAAEARSLCKRRYHVPPEIRQRMNYRARRDRQERRLEQRNKHD